MTMRLSRADKRQAGGSESGKTLPVGGKDYRSQAPPGKRGTTAMQLAHPLQYPRR
ncbi:MAG: hypothetical protein V4564_17750 [Pseudomonadota bacterium]